MSVANKKEGKYTVGRFIFATVNICVFYHARENNGAMQKGAFNVHEPAATAAVIPVGRKSVTPFSVLLFPKVESVLFRTQLKKSKQFSTQVYLRVTSLHPLKD